MELTPAYIGFALVSAWVLTSAIYVVTTRKIVRAAYALLATLFGIAVMYVIFQADFLAAVQVLIYVGGVNVLIIFGVMLAEHMGPVTFRKVSFNVIPAAITCALIAAALILGMLMYPWAQEVVAGEPTTAAIGRMFLTDYILPFEAAGVLLLVALLGAVAVARKEVRDR